MHSFFLSNSRELNNNLCDLYSEVTCMECFDPEYHRMYSYNKSIGHQHVEPEHKKYISAQIPILNYYKEIKLTRWTVEE